MLVVARPWKATQWGHSGVHQGFCNLRVHLSRSKEGKGGVKAKPITGSRSALRLLGHPSYEYRPKY